MPNQTTWRSSIEYHVSLRSPLRVKMGGVSERVYAFDATMTQETPSGMVMISFRTDSLYVLGAPDDAGLSRRAMRTHLLVPVDNIAGMVPQPFDAR